MRNPLFLIFISAAAIFVAVFWWATRGGIGLSPDSVVYISAARNIAEGHGITTPTPLGTDSPLTHFPPVYPLVLSLLAKLSGPHFFGALRGLNIALYLTLMALIGRWVYLRSGGSVLLTLSAGAITMTSMDLLRVYTMAWSETLFLVLVLGALELLSLHVERSSRKNLIGAAVLTALAWLTRYAGVALFAAGLLSLALNSRESLKRRTWECLVYYGFAGLPMSLWLWRNNHLTHHATTRMFVVHPLWGQLGEAAQSSLSLWLFQLREPNPLTTVGGIVVLLILIVLWRRYGKSVRATPDLRVLFVFASCYLLLITATVFFLEADLLVPDEYDRILSPLHITVLLAALTALSQEKWPRTLRRSLTVAAMIVVGYFGYTGVQEINELAMDGQQYASRIWPVSPTLDEVKRLPAGLHIYTNGRMPVYLYANRVCFEIPPKTVISSLQANPNYEKTMEAIKAELQRGAAAVVYFDAEERAEYPTRDDLQTYFRSAGFRTKDGTLWRS